LVDIHYWISAKAALTIGHPAHIWAARPLVVFGTGIFDSINFRHPNGLQPINRFFRAAGAPIAIRSPAK
jgi:hypothetical protein